MRETVATSAGKALAPQQEGFALRRWFESFLPTSRAGRTSLATLVRVRFTIIVIQVLFVSTVVWVWQPQWPLPPLLGLLAVAVGSNLLLREAPLVRTEMWISAVLVLDVTLLSVLLALTGGPANPFSVVYLVYVTLAAILTRPSLCWSVVGLSSLGFGSLFFVSVPLPAELGGHHMHHHGGAGFSAHLQGMWLAYTLAAASIAAFVSRLATTLRNEREERARAAHLLGLATLAAGAAHEIGNPLGTIRVAASELQRDAAKLNLPREVIDDLDLINSEVARAHQVLERLAAGAGELAGEAPTPAEPVELLRLARERLGESAARVHLISNTELPSVTWPVQASVQAFTQLLRNAVQASGEKDVECRIRSQDGGLRIDIEDRGEGMEPATLNRVGEPFFSTREGKGMGLGVFIARSLVEHLGGRLSIDSARHRGTTVSVWLPLGVMSS